MLKPNAPKGKRQASESLASKKRSMDIQATAMTIRDMDYVVFRPTNSYSGRPTNSYSRKPVFIEDFEDNLESINQELRNNIVGN